MSSPSLRNTPSMADENSTTRDTCLKLELPLESDPKSKESIFIKGTWFSSRFDLAITDGLNAWTCNASEAEVRKRAEQWDQPAAEYVELAERYLGFQQPGSKYNFQDAGDGHRRLSWTFEKEGTKLEWRWKCQPSSDSKQTTVAILDFLMDANIRLSEEVVRKTQSFERLKGEAEKCLSQSEKFRNEKIEFESAVYAKFVAVLNSKKAKLRELRDRISKLEAAGKGPAADDVSSDKTETFDEGTDEEKKKEAPAGEKPEPVRTQSTHLQNMIIVPEMIGSIIGVYNGKTFNQVEIKPEMIGRYLAEFSISYKPAKHGRPGIGATHSSRFIPLQ